LLTRGLAQAGRAHAVFRRIRRRHRQAEILAAHQHAPVCAPQSNAAPQRAQARRRSLGKDGEGGLMSVFCAACGNEKSAIASRGTRATGISDATLHWHVLPLPVC
jgi:hypothetical protein